MLINIIFFYEPVAFKLIIYLKIKNTYRHFLQIVNLEHSVFVCLYSFIMYWLTETRQGDI